MAGEEFVENQSAKKLLEVERIIKNAEERLRYETPNSFKAEYYNLLEHINYIISDDNMENMSAEELEESKLGWAYYRDKLVMIIEHNYDTPRKHNYVLTSGGVIHLSKLTYCPDAGKGMNYKGEPLARLDNESY